MPDLVKKWKEQHPYLTQLEDELNEENERKQKENQRRQEEYERQYSQYQAQQNRDIANSIKMSSPLEMENRAQQERVEAMNTGPNKLTPEMEYRRQMAAQGENTLTPYMAAMQATMAKMPTMPETRSNDELEERANALSSAAKVTRNARNQQGLRLLSDPGLMYNQGFTQNLRNLSDTEERTSAAAATARDYADTIMAQRNEAEYQNFMKLMQNPDFAEKSQMDADTAARGWTEVSPSLSRYSAIYDRQQARDRMAAGGGPEAESRTAFITDDEAAVYTYIWNTQGAKKANAFYDTYLKSRLDERQAGKSAEYLSEYTANNWLAANAASVALNTVSGAGMVDVGLQYMARRFGLTSRDAPVNYNTRAGRISQNVQTIRNTTAEAIEKANPNANKKLLGQSINYASFLYQTGMSMADSSLGMVLNLMGVPEAATLALMGGAAGMSAIQDARSRGASDGQALAFGIASALSEALFEKVSLDLAVDNILGAFGERLGDDSIKTVGQGILKALGKDPNKHNLVSWVLSTLAGAFVEGSEEGFTTLANTLSDRMIMGDKSEIEQRKQALLAQGVSDKEAGRAALKSWTSELLADVIGGMISGGVMGGSTGFVGQVVTPGVQSYQIANAITDYQNRGNAKNAYDRQMAEYNRQNTPALTIPTQQTQSARQADPLSYAMNKATSGETVTKQDARAIIENPQALQALRDSGVLTGKVTNDSEGRGKVVDAVNALAQHTATQGNAQQEEKVSTPPVPETQQGASETATEGKPRIPDQNKAAVLDAMRTVNPALAEAYTAENEAVTNAVNAVTKEVQKGTISAEAGAEFINQMFTAAQDADMQRAYLQSIYNSSTGELTPQALNAAKRLDNRPALRVREQENTPPVPKSGLTVRSVNDTLNENRQEETNGQAETTAPAETAEQRRAREESASFREQAGKAAGREVLDGSEWRSGMARIIQNVRNLSAARNIQQRASEAARLQHQAETRNLRQVSGQNLNVAGATANKTAQLVENDMMGAEWNQMVKDLAAQGVTLRGVIGQIESEDIAPDGSHVMIRAFVSGDNKNIVVQVDHPYLSWQQLLAHEELHRRIKENKSYRKEVMDSLLNDEKLKPYLSQIIDKYAEAYHSIRPNMTDEEIIEELLADYRAGFDMLDPLGLRTPESAKMAKRAAGDIRAVEKKGTKGEAAAESEGTGSYSTEIGNYGEGGERGDRERGVRNAPSVLQETATDNEEERRSTLDRRRSGERGPLGYGRAQAYNRYAEGQRNVINYYLDKLISSSNIAQREANVSKGSRYQALYEAMRNDDLMTDWLLTESPEAQDAFLGLENKVEEYASEKDRIEQSRNTYNRSALLTEETVDQWLKNYAAKSSPKYAQAYITRMTPEQFLNLTASREGKLRIAEQTKVLNAEELIEAVREQPLQVRIENGEVVGHEGRHRSTALSRVGVRNVPVLVFDSSNKYTKEITTEMTLRGQEFGNSRSEATETLHNLIPLSYENRDKIVEEYGKRPAYQESLERLGARKTIRFSTEIDTDYLAAVDRGDMETAQKMVDKAAERALTKSAIRTKSGKLMKVLHGTEDMFTVFDTSVKGGAHGSAEGFGIYTTPSEDVASKYGERQIGMYADIRKPARDDRKTITSSKLKALIRTTCQQEARQWVDDGEYDSINEAIKDTWISNYVNTYDTDINSAYTKVANEILRMNDSDKMVIQEVMAGMGIRDYEGAYEFYRNALIPVTGFDGFITEWNNTETGEKIPVILALESNQLKSADPVTYDDNGNVIPLSERFNSEKKDIRFSREVRPDVLERLDKQLKDGNYVIVYHSMYQDKDGNLYSPMAGKKKVGDEWVMTDPTDLNTWYKSDTPESIADLIENGSVRLKDNGKWSYYLKKPEGGSPVPAALNPWNHASTDALNDQFTSAYDRENDEGELVTVECIVPLSEVDPTVAVDPVTGEVTTKPYEEKGMITDRDVEAKPDPQNKKLKVSTTIPAGTTIEPKDSVGLKMWKAGPVHGQISGKRPVYLSRWIRNTRVLSTEETAKMIAKTLKDEGFKGTIPGNVVGLKLRQALEAEGVQFGKPQSGVAKGYYSYMEGQGYTREQANGAKLGGSASIEVDPDVAAQFSPEGIDKRQVSELLSENEELKQKLKKAKAQIKTSDRTQPREEDVRRMAKDILKAYDSEASVSGITDSLRELAHTVMSNDTRWTDVHDQAVKLAGKIIENASTLVNSEDAEIHRKIRNDIRSTAISFSNKSDIADYNQWRKDNFGRLTISENGMPVDTRWQELQDTYGEGYFPDDITNPADQVVYLAELWDRLQNVYENPYSADMAEATQFLANDIIDRVISGEMRQAPTTYADRAEARLARETLRGELRVQKVMERLQAERERRNEKIAELKEHYKSKEAKGRENRKARDMRAKIEKHAKQMLATLEHPTDKKHIPDTLLKSVKTVLAAIDLGSGYDTTTGQDGKTLRVGRGTEGAEQTKRTKAFLELREALLKEADGLVLDPELLGTVEEPGNLTRLVTELADVPIANMNTEQLQVVYDALRGIEGAVKSANHMLSQARWAAVSEAADAIRGENSAKHAPLQLAGAAGRAQDLTRLDMLTPEGFFHRLGKSGQAVFKMLRGAQDQFITNMTKATNDTQKIVGDTDVGALEKEKHTVTMGGEEVTMTTAQIMELYCLMQRDQGLQHITTGGIMIEPVRQGLKQTTQTEPVHPSMEELLDAVRLLTPDEIRMADAMQDYLSKDMAELGNAATLAVYGYKKFGQEAKYWKIRSNKNEIQQSIEKETQTTSVANRGFTKAVNPNANTSVKIGSIFDTYSQSVNDMATYAAWLAVGEDVNRIRNYVFKDSEGQRTGTVKGILDRVIGSGGANYLQRLLADIANGAGMDDTGLTSGFVGAYKAAAIGANIRVIIQQPTAILRAAEMIDPKYLATGLKNPMKAFERAKEYSPIAQWKDWGYFDINTGRKMKDVLFESSSKLEKVRQVSMAMAGKADSFAWGQLWGAVEAEAKDKGLKPGTKEFYEACAERFNDIIDHTQVVDGILQRSQIMRSKNAITRMAVSFMSEPTKQYNQFMSAVYDYKHSGDKKQAKQMLARTTFSMLAAGIMNVLAQSIVDALRNGDREKKYWEKLLQSFLGYNPDDDTFGEKFKTFAFSNMGELINPASYLPYAKDIMSIIQGYSVERMDMDGLSDTITAITRLAKAINGEGKQTVGYSLGKAIEQGAKLLGLSAYNVDRDLTALITTIANDADMPVLQYYLNRYRYRPGENLSKDLKGILWDARQKNDGSYDIIVDHLLKDGYTQEQIDKVVVQKVSDESGFTDARKAADAEGNNNGSYDLSETLEALGNATLSEEDRDVLLEAKLSDKQYGNYTTLLQYSDYDTWLSVMQEMPATLSQAKIEAVLDKRDDLTTTQKAAYWQVLSGSKSTKNNPYSQEVGAEILNAKAENQPDAEPEKVTQMRTTLSGLGLQDSKVDALAPVLGGDGSNTSKWRAVANQNLGKDQQDAVLKSIMTDAMYRNWSIASGESISLDSYVKGREAYVDLDNSGTDQNGEWTAALEKVDFDKDASRNNYIKGVLWQIYTGSTSTKNNPFDKAGGQAVLDAKSKGGGKGTGSNAPARIPTLRIPAAPTVTKPSSGLRIRGTQPSTAPRSGLRIRAK